MKKIVSLLLVACLLAALCACGAPAAEPQPVEVPEQTEVAEAPAEKTTIRLGALKGPTTMGMVKLLDDAENGLTQNDYEFTMAAAADELTPKLVKGELDILAVPANLGAILYKNTDGAVKFAAVNALGLIYVVEKGGEEVQSIESLKGKTIYATGKGTTPEYALSYLLSQYGLDINSDVTMEWKSEPTEVVAALSQQDNGVAMIPQPFVTVAQTQVEGLRVALDLTKEWDALGSGSKFITAGLIVRAAFAEEHPDALNTFLEEYAASAAFVNANVEEGAQLIEKYEIVKAPIAQKAIPFCNIVCITGQEMVDMASGYLAVLFEQNPAAVGGALPDDAFYYVAQ